MQIDSHGHKPQRVLERLLGLRIDAGLMGAEAGDHKRNSVAA